MVTHAAQVEAEVWALRQGLVIRWYHTWKLGDVDVITVFAVDEGGNAYTKTMDPAGLEVLIG